jgi:hypothetical protein
MKVLLTIKTQNTLKTKGIDCKIPQNQKKTDICVIVDNFGDSGDIYLRGPKTLDRIIDMV